MIDHRKDFTSWSDFMQYVSRREAAGALWRNASQRPQSARFFGTTDYASALDLARSGWREGTRRILDGAADLARAHRIDSAPAFEWDVAGEAPDVAAFCAGIPEHMATPAPGESATKPTLDVLVNLAASHGHTTAHMTNYGIAVLTHINALMEAGYSPRVFVGCTLTTKRGAKRYAVTVPINEYGAPLDVDRLAFALAHPAMLRRLFFAVFELEGWKRLGSCLGYPATMQDDEQGDIDTVLPTINRLCPLVNGEPSRRASRLETASDAADALAPYFSQ